LFQAEYAEVCYRNIEIKAISEGPLEPAYKTAGNALLPAKIGEK
jgi:hypothetical protein